MLTYWNWYEVGRLRTAASGDFAQHRQYLRIFILKVQFGEQASHSTADI